MNQKVKEKNKDNNNNNNNNNSSNSLVFGRWPHTKMDTYLVVMPLDNIGSVSTEWAEGSSKLRFIWIPRPSLTFTVGPLFLENIIPRIGSGNVFSKRKHCLCIFVEPVLGFRWMCELMYTFTEMAWFDEAYWSKTYWSKIGCYIFVESS